LLIAQEDAITWVGRANAGDIVGLVDDEVVLIEPQDTSRDNLADVAVALLDRMLAVGGELVTCVLGAGAPDSLESSIAERIRAEHPEVEFAAYRGGQTDTVLIIGVE
jgi:dihydroxyacetone kinase-like predicted kinase